MEEVLWFQSIGFSFCYFNNEQIFNVDNYLLSVGDTSALESDAANIFSFKSEFLLILNFINFFNSISPDFVSGFYSDSFDLQYILKRASILKIDTTFNHEDKTENTSSFPFLSASWNSTISHIFGNSTSLDCCSFARKISTSKFGNSLNSVSLSILAEGKSLLSRSTSTLMETADGRSELANYMYCLKDVILTLKLFSVFQRPNPSLLFFKTKKLGLRKLLHFGEVSEIIRHYVIIHDQLMSHGCQFLKGFTVNQYKQSLDNHEL
ncbi:hypothetical protein GEMRC1_010472 [Eukaryota sp. GEM-RC1]